ncbi:hypothetical protein [Sphingomonas sp. CARO-RG-8B-R24-01]|uniref:hypothetical protein n=1 Tax=Sphingomonas sp. CARO-RG-8B-R24-01 TaxID=2914831 RepID=UPI001F55BECE|nr:hypothetical protein [Sphingomonas sp. CARO-RG-8B-R24-01]
MPWLYLPAYFLGGAFLANAIPHVVSGMTGRAFQSPFATPSGAGLSSSTVNVLWGFANLVLCYLLVAEVGVFDGRNAAHAACFGCGMLAIGLFAARHFGCFHGGASPEPS